MPNDAPIALDPEGSDHLLLLDPIAAQHVAHPHAPSHPDLVLPHGVADDDMNEIDAIVQLGRWDGDDGLDGKGESGDALDGDDDCDYTDPTP